MPHQRLTVIHGRLVDDLSPDDILADYLPQCEAGAALGTGPDGTKQAAPRIAVYVQPRAQTIIERLEIRCTRCERAGRYRVGKLIEEHGPDARLPDLRHRLAADCPQVTAREQERFDLVFPGLIGRQRVGR